MQEKKFLFTNRDLCRLILPMIIEQMLAVLVGLSLGTSMVLDALYQYLGLLWRRLRRDEPAPVS